MPIDTKKSQSTSYLLSCYNDIRERVCSYCPVAADHEFMEYPVLCSVTAGMLIKKGGFVMCKRKIKTIEAIFFLILFSVIVLLLPQDAHARVRVVT